MAGNYGVARAHGRLSLGLGEGRLRLHWQSSLIVQHFILSLLEEEREKQRIKGGANTQYPVAGQTDEPFRLCVFRL